MAETGKGIPLVILGIVAILAIVGLVLLFSKAGATGQVARAYTNYPGWQQGNPNALSPVEAGAKGSTPYARPGYSAYVAQKAQQASQERYLGTNTGLIQGSTYKQIQERR